MGIAFRRLQKFFQGCLYGTALRVSQNHDESGTESRRGELDAVNLGRCDDITGNTDDKRSPSPWSKIISVGTRESEQPRMIAKGACSFAISTRCA